MRGLFVAIAAVLTIAAPGRSQTPFVHPGLLSGAEDLAAIQKRVAAHDPTDPIVAGYDSTMGTRFADVDFMPKPHARPQRIKGPKVPGEDGPPVDQRNSAMTAYTLALKWAVVGDAKARDKAIAIMNAWSAVYEDQEGDENRFLDTSWATMPWCSAAELIRYAKIDGKIADWPADQVEQFKGMIRKMNAESSQIIVKPFNPTSNWGSSAMLADMAAGVFLDDRAVYTRGRDAMLKYMPGIIKKDGYCNEVFRDPWHGIVALTGTIQAAEVGRHQGDLSIYHAKFDGQDKPRLLVSIKWYADPLRGKGVDLPPMGGEKWKPKPWTFNADHTSKNTGGFEIALNFYQFVEPSPGLVEFCDAVLKTYRPSGQDNALFIESDTLTHGDLNAPAH